MGKKSVPGDPVPDDVDLGLLVDEVQGPEHELDDVGGEV